MTTDQPGRVTLAEISEFLRQAVALGYDASLADRIAYYERMAQLLTRLGGDIGTPDVQQLADEAWDQLAALAARLRQKVQEDTEPT